FPGRNYNDAGHASRQRFSSNLGGYSAAQSWSAGYYTSGSRAALAKYWSEPAGNGVFRWSADVHPSTGGSFTNARFATKQGDLPEFPNRFSMRWFPEAPFLGTATQGQIAARFNGAEHVISSVGPN